MEKTYEGFLNIFKKKRENIPWSDAVAAVEEPEPLEPLNPDEIFHEFGKKNVLGKVPTIQDIKDCFTDLADLDFNVLVDANVTYISIRKRNKFKYEEVKECLLFAIPYLQDEYGMRLSGGSIDYVLNNELRGSKTLNNSERFNTVDKMNRYLQKNHDREIYQMDLFINIKGLTKK